MGWKIERLPLAPQVAKVDFKEHVDKELLVWWYRELIKGRVEAYQPNVLVCFREIGPNNELTNNFYHLKIALTELGQFRIGTIWQNQICRQHIRLDVETFQVDFDPGAWRYYSTAANKEQGRQSFIPHDIYELHEVYQHDKVWMLQFPFSDDPVGLLLPCLEFFSRCYGRSQHVKRVLATYPWKIAKGELLAPLTEPAKPGTWAVNLKKRAVNSDVVLLAHLNYDEYARQEATAIWSQLEGAQGPYGGASVFAKVGPWFKGAARLKVKGLWIERGKRFLGLQVIGCSDPGGVPIFRDRENTNKTGPLPASAQEGGSWNGVPPKEIKPPREIIDITSSETPDHGAVSIEIDDPDFELLGNPREVVDIRRREAKSTKGENGSGSKSDRYSGDETAGTGKGVGYGSIQAKTIMESQGTLRDVWNMLKRLESLHPDIVRKVEFLNADGSFSTEVEPTLIAFSPFTQDERDTKEPSEPNWPLLDTKTSIPRGALLARIDTPKGHVHFFEIQRRPRTIKKEGEKERLGEQPFRGLVFVLKQPSALRDWANQLLNQVRYTSGVLTGIAAACPGNAFAFKHVPAAAEKYPQERAVVRALSLMGIKIPDEPENFPRSSEPETMQEAFINE